MNRVADSTNGRINPYESEDERKARIAHLLKHYDEFCYHYFPLYCQGKMGGFHMKAVKSVIKNPNKVHLWQWSREFAKSTHANCMLPIFLYLNSELNGMMGGSANEDLAIRLMMDIKANLEANQAIISDFGTQRSHGNWDMDSFVTNKGIGFFAFGANQSPRGTRFGHRRPDYGTIDDLNDKKSLKNDQISIEQFEWVKEDFMGALSTKKWRLIIPQNKFHKNTVTAKFEADKEVATVLSRVNMLNDADESNWPEYLSTAECKAKQKASGYISSQREYQNNPIEEGKIFKTDNIAWTKRLAWNAYDFLVAYTDPSYKNNQKSDYKATVLVGKKGLEFHVLKVFLDKVGIREMFLWHYELDNLVGDHTMIHHRMEASFIQDMHLKVLTPLAEEKKRHLRLTGDYRAKPDKFQRISSLDPMFNSGILKFNKAEEEDPHMARLLGQFTGFEKGTSLNDDGPDAVEGAIFILESMVVNATPPANVPKKRSRFAY